MENFASVSGRTECRWFVWQKEPKNVPRRVDLEFVQRTSRARVDLHYFSIEHGTNPCYKLAR